MQLRNRRALNPTDDTLVAGQDDEEKNELRFPVTTLFSCADFLDLLELCAAQGNQLVVK
jgi:hypothetical protein